MNTFRPAWISDFAFLISRVASHGVIAASGSSFLLPPSNFLAQ